MATQAHAKAEDVKLDVSPGPQQEPDSLGEKEPEVVRIAKEPPQPSAASKLLRSMSIVHQTQNAVSALIEKNQGIPVNHPALNIRECHSPNGKANDHRWSEPVSGWRCRRILGDYRLGEGLAIRPHG